MKWKKENQGKVGGAVGAAPPPPPPPTGMTNMEETKFMREQKKKFDFLEHEHEMEQAAHNRTKNELKRTEIDLLATKKELVATKKKMADLKEKIGAAEAGPGPPNLAGSPHVGKIKEVPELDEGHNR